LLPVAANSVVEVQGARQLRRTLKAAGEDLADLKAAHKQASTIALGGISPLVPVRSGRLAATLRAAGTNTAGIVRAGKKAVPYAGMVQWGRKRWPSMISTPKDPYKQVNSFVKPRLFMTDGAKATEPEWVAVYEAALDRAMNQIKGK